MVAFKFFIAVLVALPFPLLAWYVAVDSLYDHFHRLWLAPMVLSGCLGVSALGFRGMLRITSTGGATWVWGIGATFVLSLMLAIVFLVETHGSAGSQ